MNETATTIDGAGAGASPRPRGGRASSTGASSSAASRRHRGGRGRSCSSSSSGWPPHEDETLPLFVGRQPLGGLFDIVLGKRGGAPLHFLLAWVVAHAGGGLHAMRFLSALFAVASVPAIAILGNRLAGRGPALAATALAAASWVLLFHGIYARMYSLFLFLSTLSYLALLRALERGGARAWTLWAVVMLLTIGAHQYGALVLGSQGLYVLAHARAACGRRSPPSRPCCVLAIPLWRSSLVLASRFDVGVGGGGGALRTPRRGVRVPLARRRRLVRRLHRRARRRARASPSLGLAVLARERPRSALLAALRRPHADALLPGRPLRRELGAAVAPPDLRAAVPRARGRRGDRRLGARAPGRCGAVARRARRRSRSLPAEVAWGWHKTPALFERENPVRVDARRAAAEWLAPTSRPDDVLFAYEPALPRRLGARPLGGLADGRPARRPEARPRGPRRGATSRSAAASGSSTPATTTTT